MKIPKEIENALKRRVRAAETLLETDRIVSDFIEERRELITVSGLRVCP